ncbi:MAG: spore maturation protein [Clostridiales bacterium]|nr:spore maturation protein [Clostridiales bacterium]
MSNILSTFSILFLPLIITIILLYGIIKKVPIYDAFIAGAKDGLKTCVEILPFIIGIFIAIEALTSSGAMNFIEQASKPLFDLLGIPEELISIIFLRPVSGSGSLVVVEKIMEISGPDSLIGRAASVMVGSCETVFYVLALYFGVTSVKKMRHAFAAGLIGYIVGVLASVYICYVI